MAAAIKATDIAEKRGSSYPSPHDEPCVGRSNRRLGDVFGLTDFGANLLTLNPGAWSSQRHWHSHEDELIYVLEGTPSLVTDAGEQLLAPGAVAGFPAGDTDGHHLVNNSDKPALILVVGSRKAEDDAFYSDIDMQLLKRAQGGRFAHKSGQRY
jgi:uncharacterized cupin superfamily protein